MKSVLIRYGKQVNSHDLLKVLGTLLMVIDHVGMYLYPEQIYLRIIGRGAAPLFFFATGSGKQHNFKSNILTTSGTSSSEAVSLSSSLGNYFTNDVLTVTSISIFVAPNSDNILDAIDSA